MQKEKEYVMHFPEGKKKSLNKKRTNSHRNVEISRQGQ